MCLTPKPPQIETPDITPRPPEEKKPMELAEPEDPRMAQRTGTKRLQVGLNTRGKAGLNP